MPHRLPGGEPSALPAGGRRADRPAPGDVAPPPHAPPHHARVPHLPAGGAGLRRRQGRLRGGQRLQHDPGGEPHRRRGPRRGCAVAAQHGQLGSLDGPGRQPCPVVVRALDERP